MPKQTGIRPSLLLVLVSMMIASIWAVLNPKPQDDSGVELADIKVHTQLVNQPNIVAATEDAQNLLNLPKVHQYQRQTHQAAIKDIFHAHSWAAPMPKAKPIPPPPPAAPAAPYVFVGNYDTDTGENLVFLTAYNKLYTVKPGSNIDANWRLDTVEGSVVKLTYLPLNLPQTLSKTARAPSVAQPVPETPVNEIPS